MNDHFETFTRKICEYCMKNYVIPYLREHGYIQSYRAVVVSKNASAGTMVIQRPYDNPVTLPYVSGAASLSAGSECTVFSLGEELNSVIVADGELSQL